MAAMVLRFGPYSNKKGPLMRPSDKNGMFRLPVG